MKTLRGALLAVATVASLANGVSATTSRSDAPDVTALSALAARQARELAAGHGDIYRRLLASRDAPDLILRSDPGIALQYVDERGMPRYYAVDNVNAARTISTDDVQPGGSGGFNLNGSGTPAGRLGMWDSGRVRTTHVELVGRHAQIDSPSATSAHSTHVAGTLIAAGIDAAAKGMSPAARLRSWDYNSDLVEMPVAAAAGLRISNHSYSPATGWVSSGGEWFWYGDPAVSPVEDYGFGFYGSAARAYDEIAYAAPGYLIVGSAGNNRVDVGPGPGGQHWVWSGSTWVSSTVTRDPDGGATGYDTIPWQKNAKNALVVGAVDDIPGGYAGPASVAMTTFSSWGPTDDGRIKPDICANGVSLRSCVDGSNTAYGQITGTSMSSPSVAGSLNLIVDHWQATHDGTLPRAATLKAIAFETADECGPADGPDYRFGWGLMNTLTAARLVSADAADTAGAHVWEAELADGETDAYHFTLASPETVRVTIHWTDVPHEALSVVLDNPTLVLVNDLDLRVGDGSATWAPWVLDPSNPSAAAATGDNIRDNTEQIAALLPAGSYTLSVSHKGVLVDAPQAYSLAASLALTDHAPPVTAPAAMAANPGNVAPNPFTAATTISFRLPAAGPVTLAIFDVQGRLVRMLAASATLPSGTHRIEWDSRGQDGRPVPAGVYFARLEAGSASRVDKLVRLRPR